MKDVASEYRFGRALRVPLHTQGKSTSRIAHRFDNTIGRSGYNLQRAGVGHDLSMMTLYDA